MSEADVEQTGEPRGAAISEEAVALAKLAIEAELYAACPHPCDETCVAVRDESWPIVARAVAALVTAAEERGFDRGVRAAGSGPALAAVRAEAEWRGAEKERERTAAALLAVDPVEWALAGQHAGVEAAKIVRGES